MAQVSLRIKKLKKADLGVVQKHNEREEIPPHANKEQPNFRSVGKGHSITNLVLDKIKESGASISSGKQNESTVAVEIVLSASPEFFRPGSPESWGVFDEKRTLDWANASANFLSDKYGKNLVALDLHLDEATPHIHAIVVPLEMSARKKRRTKKQIKNKEPAKVIHKEVLNAAKQFNRQALIDLQTQAALAVKHLGIERGKRGSKAKHTTLKTFYQSVKQTVIHIKDAPQFIVPNINTIPPKNPIKYRSFAQELEGQLIKAREVNEKTYQQAQKYASDIHSSAIRMTTKLSYQEKVITLLNEQIDELKKSPLHIQNEGLREEVREAKGLLSIAESNVKKYQAQAGYYRQLENAYRKSQNENQNLTTNIEALESFLKDRNLITEYLEHKDKKEAIQANTGPYRNNPTSKPR